MHKMARRQRFLLFILFRQGICKTAACAAGVNVEKVEVVLITYATSATSASPIDSLAGGPGFLVAPTVGSGASTVQGSGDWPLAYIHVGFVCVGLILLVYPCGL